MLDVYCSKLVLILWLVWFILWLYILMIGLTFTIFTILHRYTLTLRRWDIIETSRHYCCVWTFDLMRYTIGCERYTVAWRVEQCCRNLSVCWSSWDLYWPVVDIETCCGLCGLFRDFWPDPDHLRGLWTLWSLVSLETCCRHWDLLQTLVLVLSIVEPCELCGSFKSLSVGVVFILLLDLFSGVYHSKGPIFWGST